MKLLSRIGQFFFDYKDALSYGRLASIISLLTACTIGIRGMYIDVKYSAYNIKTVMCFLIAAGVFYLISKSPELWSSAAVKIIAQRFGITLDDKKDEK